MATHVMSVTDGTTTLTLTSGEWLLSDYQMAYPRRGADGVYESVTETIELNAFGASTTAVQTTVNTLETMLQRASSRQRTGVGDKIYLQIKVANESLTWRSELLGGEIEISPDTLRAWNQALALVRVHIERVHYWEGPEAQAVLKAQFGGQSTSVQPVYNVGAGAVLRNFVEIEPTGVTGVLPTPAIIRMINPGATKEYISIYVALGKFRVPSAFQHIYDAEDILGAGTVTVDANSANGFNVDITTSTTPVLSWWDALIDQEQTGRTYRMLLHLKSYTASGVRVYIRPIIAMSGNTYNLWQGDEVLLPINGGTVRSIVDIGIVPIPLSILSALSSGVMLKLEIRSSSAGSVVLDFIQLTPLDGYRILKPTAYALTTDKVIVDDGIEGVVYADDDVPATPAYVPLDAGVGSFIDLFPGESQRLYFLRTLFTTGAVLNDLLNTKIYYRPRRLTI